MSYFTQKTYPFYEQNPFDSNFFICYLTWASLILCYIYIHKQPFQLMGDCELGEPFQLANFHVACFKFGPPSRSLLMDRYTVTPYNKWLKIPSWATLGGISPYLYCLYLTPFTTGDRAHLVGIPNRTPGSWRPLPKVKECYWEIRSEVCCQTQKKPSVQRSRFPCVLFLCCT